MEVASIIISVIALLISVWAVKIRKETLDEQRSSKKLAMYQDLLGKFMTHNWKLYEHKISPELPETSDLTSDQWKARIVALDHLNFLFYVYLHATVSPGNVLTKADLQGWKRFANDWLKTLLKDPIKEKEFGKVVANADLYPEDFLVWLNNDIFEGRLRPYLSEHIISRFGELSTPKRAQ
jgi:hypothetical protein